MAERKGSNSPIDPDVLLTKHDVREVLGRIVVEPIAVGGGVVTAALTAGLTPDAALNAGAGATVITAAVEAVRFVRRA